MSQYRPESYPPRGEMWPQFWDKVLGDSMSVTDAARQSLSKKREAMSDFHKENLQHHGLAPREEVDAQASQPAAALQEPAAQEELPIRLHEVEPDAPAPPRIQRGASGMAVPGAIHYANDSLPETRPDYPMSSVPRVNLQENLVPPGFPSAQGGLRARDSFRIPPDREIGLATQATPLYAAPMPVDEVANADMASRVDKRLREVKLEPKTEVKTEEPKVKIKQEPGDSHRGPGFTSSAQPKRPPKPRPPPILPDDEELQTLSVKYNNNEDMSYWEGASAQELRAQLNLRYPQMVGDWENKDRTQLISIVRGLIRKNQWVQGGGSQGTAQASKKRPAPSSAEDDNDDDVEVGDVTWDTNQDPEYWKEQSAGYIRSQLTRRFPSRQERHAFAFLKERQEYIDYIVDLIRKGKW